MVYLKQNESVFHMMYGRGIVININNNIAEVKYDNNILKSYVIPNDLIEGNLFKINEDNMYRVNKSYGKEFKDFVNIQNELKEINIDEILLINLYKKYKNEYLLKWILDTV